MSNVTAEKDMEITYLKRRDAAKSDSLELYRYVDERFNRVEQQSAQQAVINAQVAGNLLCMQHAISTLSGLTSYTPIPRRIMMKGKIIMDALLRTQLDHIKDAEMLLDYAEDMKELGESSLCSMFISQAKARLASAADCDHIIYPCKQRLVDEVKRNNAAFSMDVNNGYAMAYKKYIADTVDALKRRCDLY